MPHRHFDFKVLSTSKVISDYCEQRILGLLNVKNSMPMLGIKPGHSGVEFSNATGYPPSAQIITILVVLKKNLMLQLHCTKKLILSTCHVIQLTCHNRKLCKHIFYFWLSQESILARMLNTSKQNTIYYLGDTDFTGAKQMQPVSFLPFGNFL